MARIVMEEFEEFPTFAPDTIIGVKVDGIYIKEVQGQRGPWMKADFTFKVLSVPSDRYNKLVGEKVYGSVPFRFTESPDNKLRQWVEAIFGMELSAGFELDTDLLIGREARAVMSNYDKKAKDPKTGQPYKGHQVDALLPKAGTSPNGFQQQQPPALVTSPPTPAADPWAQTGSTFGSDEPPF